VVDRRIPSSRHGSAARPSFGWSSSPIETQLVAMCEEARRFDRGRFSRAALIRSRRANSSFKSVFEGGDPFALNASQAAEVMGGNLVDSPKA
jgi:hypothetical protein